MKHNKFMEQLEKISENPEKVNVQELESLLLETLKFFDGIREKMTSSDPQVRDKAMEEALEMQEKLNKITESIYAKTGLTKEKANQILSNPANFKPDDWEAMKKMQKELSHFHKGIWF